MDSSKLTYEEEERKRQRRKEWLRERELERKHNLRKAMMIEEYEKNRARTFEKNKSWRSKSASPHRRSISTDYKRPEESKVLPTLKSTKIDTKELHQIKIKIERTISTNKSKTEQNNLNSGDIIPRRKDEGSRPLFDSLVVSEKQSSNKDNSETSGGSSNYYNYNYSYNYTYNNTIDNHTIDNHTIDNHTIDNYTIDNHTNTIDNSSKIRGRDNLRAPSTRVDHGSRVDRVDIKQQEDKRNRYNKHECGRSRSLSISSNHSKRRMDDKADGSKDDYRERSHRSNRYERARSRSLSSDHSRRRTDSKTDRFKKDSERSYRSNRYERYRSRSVSSDRSKRRTDDKDRLKKEYERSYRSSRYEHGRSRSVSSDRLKRRRDRFKEEPESRRSNNPAVSDHFAGLRMNCPPYIRNYFNYFPFPAPLPLIRAPLPFIPPYMARPLTMPPCPRFRPRVPNMNTWRPR